ncbi:chaperone protein [Nannochloropsis gaditana]|uniref:Chaperone protein n=1 Tax=Nannochloropsis gaditana TaxID=72520 RepID=W7TN00_9STRA|nr:chaperone protein [Nannochloropsis gaditana]
MLLGVLLLLAGCEAWVGPGTLPHGNQRHLSTTTISFTPMARWRRHWGPHVPNSGPEWDGLCPVVLRAAKRWGGMRKKIENDDGDGNKRTAQSNSKGAKPFVPKAGKKAAESEEEEDVDPLAISDAMIEEVTGRVHGRKLSRSEASGKAASDRRFKNEEGEGEGRGTESGGVEREPPAWSMRWLETLSEEEMLALDKKRLMDLLLKDIESDKEWAGVPVQALFDPDEEVDPKTDFYDEGMTEEIFGKMPEGEDEDEEAMDLDDILGPLGDGGEEGEEEEGEEDLLRFLSGSQEGRRLARDLLNDDTVRDDEEDEDVFDVGGHLRAEEMSSEEVEDGLRHLWRNLKKGYGEDTGGGEEGEEEAAEKEGRLRDELEDPAAVLTALKASVEGGDLAAASELLQRMEEMGLEVGDLEEEVEALDSYRAPLGNKRAVAKVPLVEEAEEEGGELQVPLSVGRLSEEEVAAMKSVGACVGIDLGTTNSALSLVKDGKALILPSRTTGAALTPSVVRFRGKEVVVGEAARAVAVADSDNTFSSVKRLMGRGLEEMLQEKEILGSLNLVRRTVEEAGGEDEGGVRACVAMRCPALGREVTPEEVSAEILKTLLGDAAAYLEQPVNRAVITVPAYFTPAQCAATERAGALAGLQRIKLLREPEAAALAYGLDRMLGEDELIMVFDLGGGTFDVSVLEVGDGVVEVLSTFGDATLGGNDFDKRVADWLVGEYRKQHGGQGPPSDRTSQRKLMEAAEGARVRLSQASETEVRIPALGGEGKDLGPLTLTRAGMEKLCGDLYDRLLEPMRQAALMAGATLGGEVAPDALGGQLVDALGDGGEKAAMEVLMRDQELAAADAEGMESEKEKLAALMRERAMTGRKVSKARSMYSKNLNAVRKRNPGLKIREFPQGRSIQEVVMVGGATRMPSIRRLVAAVTGITPRTTVDPDEAVALGAGIHAGVLDGIIEDMDMLTPMQAAIARGLLDYEARAGQAGPRSQKQRKGF